MNTAHGPPKRGKRSPTSVWILRRNGKRGVTYRLRWIDPQTGKIASDACGRDLAHARSRRDAKKAELREGLSGKLPDKNLTDLANALDTFMVGKSPHTIRKTRRSLNELVSLCSNRRLEHIDRALLMEFRAKRLGQGVVGATVNKDMRGIKSSLSYAVDAGWMRTNPLWRWKGLQIKEPEKRIRVVELEEFEHLLEACPNPAFRALMIVGYYQGLRRSELANLRWSAVNFERGLLHVENVAEAGEFTKSRKGRTLPMRDVVKDELAALHAGVPEIIRDGNRQPKYPHCFTWANGEAFRPDWATTEFARVAKRSGIPHCTLHDLRRSFATLAQRAGVDKHTVKDLGGWSTVGVVEKHYTGDVSGVLERAMNQIAVVQEKVG